MTDRLVTNVARTRSPGAEHFLPDRLSLPALRAASEHCEGCPLYLNATQVVFGEGARRARVMLVGEQPGNAEDLQGRPFVGPAGQLLDKALGEAGIDRADAYVTNAVKHFKWTRQGKNRIHKKPNADEIRACRPWLEAELAVVKPLVIVCLGATAAQALLGRDFRVTRDHGRLVATDLAPQALGTLHPAAVLRSPSHEERERAFAQVVEDLRVVAGHLASTEGKTNEPRKRLTRVGAERSKPLRV
jgi:uracil-DNA glycosylase